MLKKIRQMEGTQELIVEYGRVGGEGKMALLLGRIVKRLEREVGDRVDERYGGSEEVVAEEEETGLQWKSPWTWTQTHSFPPPPQPSLVSRLHFSCPLSEK